MTADRMTPASVFTIPRLINPLRSAVMLIAVGVIMISFSASVNADEIPRAPQAKPTEHISGDLHETELPFKPFGSVSNKESDAKFPCKLESDAPRVVFDLLLKWSAHGDSAAAHLFGRQICTAEYMPLGQNRFLVEYRGLGVVNVVTGKYTRLFASWIDGNVVSKMHKLNGATSIGLYQTITSKYEEVHGFYALLFHQTGTGDVTVQYAGLTGASAGYVKDDTNEPFCPENGDGPEIPPETANAILFPSVDIIALQGKAIFTFVLRSKNCKTGLMTDVQQRFTYDSGKLTDQNGQSIPILNLEDQ